MSAQSNSLWLIRVQGKTINTEPLMQCQKTSLEATYWVILTRGGEWNEKLCVIRIPDELMIWPTGEVKTEKRIGPSTEPWGTPVFSEVSVDFDWPTTTLWTLSAKYERIQVITLPEIPNPVWSLVWSRVCGDQLYQTQRSGQVIQGLLADWSQQPCIPDQAYSMFLWSGSGGRLTAVG